MKTLFTGRVAIISLIFGSSGYGLTTLFPIEHCSMYAKFPYLGIIVAVLTSFLISILIPSKMKSANKKYYNIGLSVLFIISIISCFVFFNAYNNFTFYPNEFKSNNDSTIITVVNDNTLFFQSGINGLTPELRKVVKESDYNATDVYFDAGGLQAYLQYNIWTKQSMDRSAMILLLYYFFFIISLIATTFAFLEVLKYRRYTDEIVPRKATTKKLTSDQQDEKK